ncbi:hypothetical protein F4677DRAFT_146182 [Hypoxylon crocopeplum]|nr:hypothetical protein F4677DRAFT_146182 [Hypoxylon crocopeplum]
MLHRYCPLCDILVDGWMSLDDALANPAYRLSWLQEVRAIRTRYLLEGPFVTGVGWLNADNQVVAPVEYESHYHDCEPLLDLGDYFTAHQVGYPPGEPGAYWCYVVHNACWELLRDRIDPDHRLPVNNLARHLFALLYNTPIDAEDEALAPGHNFGHASALHLHSGELYSSYFTRVNASYFSFVTGDLTEKFDPDEDILEDGMSSRYARSARSNTYIGNYSESDPFYLLPSEIVMLIFAHLPSNDVCELRLASRYVADLSSPEKLDQQFWSSRFDPDLEMGFVFAGPSNPRPPEPADWRSLYLKAKTALGSELFHGLQNRSRIWRVFQHISEAICVRLGNEKWIGDSLRHAELPSLPERTVYAEASFESSGRDTSRPLLLSCRLFEYQRVSWPLYLDAKSKTLRVSSIYLNGKTYLSGFRFSSPDDPGSVKSFRAGFVNPRKEHELVIGSHESLEYLEVAMATNGLIGLRFYIRGPRNSYSVSVGNMELTDPGSGICRLTPGDNMQCVGFHIGLDACKIVSMSLVERQAQALPDSTNNHAGPASLQHLEPVEVWNPNIPKVHPAWLFPRPSPAQYFNLCLNMDFGGPDGQQLQSLVRIVVFMGGFPSVFLGVSFVYSDGTERSYGRKSFRNSLIEISSTPAIRQDFPIDGPGGELITKITTSWSREADAIQAIAITTNWGREKQFRLYGKDSMRADEIVQVLQPDSEMYFTAFYANIQSPSGHFRNFSVHCQVMSRPPEEEHLSKPSRVSHTIPVTPDTLLSAQDMLSYPRGFSFTTANLSNLRRIRVSTNDDEHTGLQGHISGLWLEYHDSRIPVILGQWVREVDALDLSSGDRIAEVITWHGYTNRHKRAKYGPIKKLKLGTICGISKEFLDPYVGGMVCLEYRENPYEKLTGIIWGCNYEWDHVRVFHTPKTSGPLPTLLIDSATYLCPSWTVWRKGFMQETRDSGCPNPVTAFEVTFGDRANEVSGLTLIYEVGGPLTLGVRGREPRVMTLSPGEKLAQLEIGGSRENSIVFISFLTTSGRKMDCSRQKFDIINKRISHRIVHVLDPSLPGQSNTLRVKACQIPKEAGMFTGFWAVPRKHGGLRYARFGPIFERHVVSRK